MTTLLFMCKMVTFTSTKQEIHTPDVWHFFPSFWKPTSLSLLPYWRKLQIAANVQILGTIALAAAEKRQQLHRGTVSRMWLKRDQEGGHASTKLQISSPGTQMQMWQLLYHLYQSSLDDLGTDRFLWCKGLISSIAFSKRDRELTLWTSFILASICLTPSSLGTVEAVIQSYTAEHRTTFSRSKLACLKETEAAAKR